MNDTLDGNMKWVPFGALLLISLTVTGFWKVEKGREVAPKPVSQSTAAPTQQPQPVMEGVTAPGFTLSSVAGNEINLEDYRGKFVFLNIWATWCAPCREEMPSMQSLYEKMAGTNFEMLALSIDAGKEEVAQFVEEFGLTFPVPLDPEQKISPQYKITGVPETFLIGPDGVVMHHIIGPGDWDSPETISAFSRLADATKDVGEGT